MQFARFISCATQNLTNPHRLSTTENNLDGSTFNCQLRTQTVPSTSTSTAAASAAAAAASAAGSAAGSAAAAVSRRPVLSVRRRIINSPTSALASASASSESGTQIAELPTTTSKYNRLRSKSTAATATTTTITTTAAAAATSNKNSNSYLNKLKTKSSSTIVEPATLSLATLTPATSNTNPNKFQSASYALRRQFQTRRLTTTASPANGDEGATDVPRTQNPLFKRRPTLGSTVIPQRSTTTAISIETTTVLDGIGWNDDEDQVAKSSIHTSRFNQIPEQVRPRVSYDLPITTTTTSTGSSAATTSSPSPPFLVNSTRRQMIARPRRPQSVTPASGTTAVSVTPALSPPASRRQQSRRRPHKYIEVYSRPPSKPASVSVSATSTTPSTAAYPFKHRSDYEYYDDGHVSNKPQTRRRNGLVQTQKQIQTPTPMPKVIVHGRGIIECLEQGNFPHPLSCRKFISCAKFEETGGIVGWEYTCPKGLGYDGSSGMCTWAAPSVDGRACR
ncbi:GH11816 [Drosophila grimshawi]|uniref:GH11816 n=1 Tax=Drosophila grimshawi TaxID=7222 RepID=B4JIR8_DROGR|nr:GH11816 [Drosophila grimshawi]